MTPQRGAMEVRARQMGANELDAIQACAAYVGVQQAYAAKKRSAAGTLEYAETRREFTGSERIRGGGRPASHSSLSRLLFPCAEGSRVRTRPAEQHPYVLGKTMIGGFRAGRLACQLRRYRHPHVHRESGLASVYEKDRGARSAMPPPSYDPDPTWKPVD